MVSVPSPQGDPSGFQFNLKRLSSQNQSLESSIAGHKSVDSSPAKDPATDNELG